MWKASTLASDKTSAGAIAGTWFAANSSRALPASLLIDAVGTASARDSAGAAHASAPLRWLQISDRVGSIPRRLIFPDGSVFETSDNDAVDRAIRKFTGRNASFVHGLELFRPRLAVFVAAVVVLCFAIYRFALPVLVEVAVAVTPPMLPAAMSAGVLKSLDETLFRPSTLPEARRTAIEKGFAELAALSPRGADAYSLNFRKGGAIGPNAFALPDGTIVVTDELIELAKSDELVLAVLGHEIGHVEFAHSLRQLYRAAGVAALIMLIGGDIGSGAEDLLVQGSALASLSYSRGAEREADRFSVELMKKAGRDPAAISKFFVLLRDKFHDTGRSDFFSTHPATPERIEETQKYADEVSAADKR
jgi:Zn-dependent protease with chaperone function